MGWWSSIKRAVKRAVKAVVSYVTEAVARIIRLPTTIATYFGYLPVKTVKLRVLVLRRSDSSPLADEDRVLHVIERARDILMASARLRLVPTSGAFVRTVNEFGSDIPPEALSLRGSGIGIIRDQLGIAGEFFDEMRAKYHSDATFPNNFITTPVTGFIVEQIEGLNGITSAIAGNWFAIDAAGLQPTAVPDFDGGMVTEEPSIIAHELGHAMGLSLIFHSTDVANLMFPGNERGTNLTQGQLMIARSSRCVSLW
jgi:hypothetical protein